MTRDRGKRLHEPATVVRCGGQKGGRAGISPPCDLWVLSETTQSVSTLSTGWQARNYEPNDHQISLELTDNFFV